MFISISSFFFFTFGFKWNQSRYTEINFNFQFSLLNENRMDERYTHLCHPIVFDSFNLCNMSRKNRLADLSVAILRTVCEHFDIDVKEITVRRKAPYLTLLKKLIDSSSAFELKNNWKAPCAFTGLLLRHAHFSINSTHTMFFFLGFHLLVFSVTPFKIDQNKEIKSNFVANTIYIWR